MADDNEKLVLDIEVKNQQKSVSALKSIDAAANKVLSTTKAQTAANKTETSSLLELEKQLTKVSKAKAAGSGSGSGSGGTGDKVLGAAGRALGAVSPGAGSALRDLEDIKEFGASLGDISKVAVGAGVGIGAAALALAALQAQASKVKEAAQVELNARSEVIGFIQTASKEEIKARVDELRQKKAINQAIADDANGVFQQLDQNTNIIGKLNAALGTNQGELSAAKENADKANKALGETDTALTLLEQALTAGVRSEKAYADAIKQSSEARTKATLASADEALSLTKKLADEQKLNFKQIQDRIDAIGVENRALQSAIDVIQLSGDTSAEAAKKITEYQVAQGKLGAELTRLGDLKPVVMNLEAEAAAREYANKQQLETIDIVKQYGSDVSTLNAKLDDNKNKLIESLDEIFANAQKAAEDALQKAQQARAELVRDAGREEEKAARDAERSRLDILIKSHQSEVDLYKSYRRKLRDIQKNADEQSFELALNRDFSGLFNLNRDTDIQKNNAAQDERDAIEDEAVARQRNLEDLSRSIEAERQERGIALQQRIADEVAAYQQERAQIEAQRKDAEAKTKAQYAKEAQLLQQQLDTRTRTAQQDLALVQQTESQRLQIYQNANIAFLAQAQALLSALTTANRPNVNVTQNITSGADAKQVGNIAATKTVQVVKQLIGVTT